MVQTYSNGKEIYSVDMMHAYINIYKPTSEHVNVDSLLEVLKYKGWGDPEKKIFYSAMDVIKYPKKYKDEIKRIKDANLRYPIILTDNNILVDGVHRLTKAYLTNRKKIKAYVFTKKEMNNFLISQTGNWKYVSKLQTYDYIKLFYDRFCK